MNIDLKTVIFESGDALKKHVESANLQNLVFECVVINDDYQKLIEWIAKNKADIIVFNADNWDRERLSYVLEMIHSNFCKNIIVACEDSFVNANYTHIDSISSSNFDLKLNMALLNIKKKIDATPAHNTTLIKSKICELLCNFMFSSKHDGFKYYVDAVLRAYVSFPYSYSTMEIYKKVGERYGKTACAVEKSMRTALWNAFNKLKDAPVTPENMKLKSYLTYDMNNNMAISMIVSRLVLDKDINAGLDFEFNYAM